MLTSGVPKGTLYLWPSTFPAIIMAGYPIWCLRHHFCIFASLHFTEYPYRFLHFCIFA